MRSRGKIQRILTILETRMRSCLETLNKSRAVTLRSGRGVCRVARFVRTNLRRRTSFVSLPVSSQRRSDGYLLFIKVRSDEGGFSHKD